MKANSDGSNSIVLQTPVVDDKGRVVGTEARTFTFLKQGRNLEVAEEGGPTPTVADKQDVQLFVKMCARSPVEAAHLLAKKTPDDFSRFRTAYRENDKSGVQLIDFVKKSFAGPHNGLGNVVCTLLYARPEFCADELHLATMGLSDNHGAMADLVAAAPRELLAQISLFYGIKFGDGRYEVKSADGRGDTDKLVKDARFALRGRLQQLLVARLERCQGGGAARAGSIAAPWDGGLCDFLASAGPAEAERVRAEHGNVAALAQKLAEGDATLARAILGILAPPEDFWTARLREAVAGGGAVNKKLVLRALAMLDPPQRGEAAKRVPELQARLAQDDEGKLLRAVFQ